MKEKPQNKIVALFIDGENISEKYIQKILEEAEKYGDLLIKRVYADWSKSSTSSWKKSIQNHSLIPIQHFPLATKKNSIDIKMSIEIMDVAHTKAIDIFAIVSSDGDYTALVQYLKEKGKIIIGMGENKTTPSYKNCFSHPFICLDSDLKTKKQAAQESLPKSNKTHHEKQEIPQNLIFMIKEMCEELLTSKNKINYSNIAEKIKQEIQGFKPSDYKDCNRFFSSFMEQVLKTSEMRHFTSQKQGMTHYIARKQILR